RIRFRARSRSCGQRGVCRRVRDAGRVCGRRCGWRRDCGEGVAMSLIDGVLALLGGIESDAIAVHEERCISVRNRNADCLRCAEACTSGALSLRGNELVVEPERCIGCGTCATACPACAIELRNPTDEELTAQLKRSIVATKGHPVIVCETALET